MFSISSTSLNRDQLIQNLSDERAGAIVVFEGWVRDHNEGKKVSSLEYQIYQELALKEGTKILAEAKAKFNCHNIVTVHREGHLKLGETAIWIGATASHRDDAFKATRFIIDEIKYRLPVWKKEHYLDQKADWVYCRHHHHHVHFEEADYYQKQSKMIDQKVFGEARILVIGAGGLGCPVLTNLAAAGVGTIGIVDHDTIGISNIHRQPLFSPHLIGEKKATVAMTRLQELNPFITVRSYQDFFDSQNADSLLEGYDLILDCTDNMQTKYLIHDFCFSRKLPLISASVYKNEGQIRTFLPGMEYGCLRCHNSTTPDDSLLGNCNDFGVMGATTSVLGSLQASEALQFLQKRSNSSLEKTIFINLTDLTLSKIKNTATSDCATCAGKIHIQSSLVELNRQDMDEHFEIIDIRNLSDEDVLALKATDKNIALCCHRGIRSKKMAEALRLSGHSNFFSLKGGACSL